MRRPLRVRLAAAALVAAAAAGIPALGPAGAISGQESAREAAAERREAVSFDVVRLYGVEGKTLVEIYSRIPTNALVFTEADGRWEAGLAFDLTVRRGEEVVLRDNWTRTKTVADRRMLDSSRLFFVETHAFLVGPGTYELDGAITDGAGKELGVLRRTLEAPQESPPASDLLLAARISPDAEPQPEDAYDPVRKNRLVLNPNPGQVYSTAVSPFVHFYVEFENVGGDPLELERVLRFREQGSEAVVKEVRAPRTYRPGWTVDFGAVNVAGLKEAAYTLELAWEAAPGGALPEPYRGLARTGEFMLVREAAMPAAMMAGDSGTGGEAGGSAGGGDGGAAGGEDGGDIAAREAAAPRAPLRDYYEGYAEADLDSVFGVLDVLFTGAERKVFRGLTPEGKRTFLNRFWTRGDPSSGTPGNEFREEVDARLTYAAERFGGAGLEGYRTPRGRIWVKYGKPDRRVERVLETGFSAPYEIWIYYTSGYKYVFLDEFRNDRYILLTSTDPEEQGRPDWQERLPPEAIQEIIRE